MTQAQFHNTYLSLTDTLYRIAYFMLESRAEAEDAVQEVFLKLWESRDSLDGIRSPKAYCITLLKNHCLDRIRRASHLSFPDHLPEQEGVDIGVKRLWKYIEEKCATPDDVSVYIKERM